jgi:hypothetical protein
MKEIDERRAHLDKTRERVRRYRIANEDNEYHVGGRYQLHLDNARLAVVAEEESVLEALREWWVDPECEAGFRRFLAKTASPKVLVWELISCTSWTEFL